MTASVLNHLHNDAVDLYEQERESFVFEFTGH